MRESTYFGRAIKFFLVKHDLTQKELADMTEQRQSTISDFIARPKRPDEKTLFQLCNKWPAPETNVRMLIEHLRDEIARAGHDPINAVQMNINEKPAPQTQLERDIAIIMKHSDDDAVTELIHDIAVLIRRADNQPLYPAQPDRSSHGAALVAEKKSKA